MLACMIIIVYATLNLYLTVGTAHVNLFAAW